VGGVAGRAVGRPGAPVVLPLVLVVLIFAGATAYLGLRMAEEKETVFSLHRSGAWISAQLQMEHLRLSERIAQYEAEPTAANRREMLLRFDIFWSRFPIVLESEEGRGVRTFDDTPEALRAVFADLPNLERALRALDPADPAGFEAVRARLDSYADPIQRLTLQVLHVERFEGGSGHLIGVQRELTIAYLVLLLAGGALIALLVRQTRRAHRLAQEAGSARDDTERARRQLQEAIASLSEGFLLLDRDMRVVLINEPYYALLPAELRDLRPGDDYRKWIRRSAAAGHYGTDLPPEAAAERRLAQLCDPQGPLELANPDGTRLVIREYVTADGGRVSLRYDITELRRAEGERLELQAQVYRAQKMEALGRLAGGIAHDFNNILMAQQGYAALLRDDLPAGSAQRDFAERILAGGQRASGLVRRILDFGRPAGGARSRVGLDGLVRDTLSLLEDGAARRIAYDCEAEEASVVADASQLAQAVANVCSNACHASEGGAGRVWVRVASRVTDGGRAGRLIETLPDVPRPGGAKAPVIAAETSTDGLNRLWVGLLPAARYCVVEVRDEGSGMDLPTLERIFDPFFTTKPQDKGVGLGLAAVHGIVLAHGGGIAIESAPGRGTRLSLFLPAAPEREAQGRQAA
jgi:signal transduction histidine kinase